MADRRKIAWELARLARELEGEAGDIADVLRVAELALRRGEVLRTQSGAKTHVARKIERVLERYGRA